MKWNKWFHTMLNKYSFIFKLKWNENWLENSYRRLLHLVSVIICLPLHYHYLMCTIKWYTILTKAISYWHHIFFQLKLSYMTNCNNDWNCKLNFICTQTMSKKYDGIRMDRKIYFRNYRLAIVTFNQSCSVSWIDWAVQVIWANQIFRFCALIACVDLYLKPKNRKISNNYRQFSWIVHPLNLTQKHQNI